MRFQKIDPQYRSCKKEAERIIAVASRYGAQVHGHISGNGSKYFELTLGEEYSNATVRVSRHEPNYGRRCDEDIMVYVGGFWGEWVWSANSFCEQFEKFFEIERPEKVANYLKIIESRAKNKKQREADARELAEKERLAESELRRQKMIENQKYCLKERCREQKITAQRIRDAFAGKDIDNKCGLYSQIRKWFADAGMELAEALVYAVED